MIQRIKSSFIKAIYIVIDIICIYFAIFFACFIREGTLSFPVSFHNLLIDESNSFRFLFFLWIIIIVFCANANRLYQTRREFSEGIEIFAVMKCAGISALVVILATYVLKLEDFPRSVWILGTGTIALFMSLWRVVKRIFVEYLASMGYNNFNVLIIGAGKVGLALADEIKHRPGLGIKVIGFLDDFKTGSSESGGTKILGKISSFPEIVQKEFISKVFITIHHDTKVFLRLLEEASGMGIAVRVIPEGFDLISGELTRYNIGFIPVLEYSDFRDMKRQIGKRLFDLTLALIIFIIFAPVFMIIGLWIRKDSQGPAIYRSKRYGLKGKIFTMYKFRSMVCNADEALNHIRDKNEVDGPIFKIRKDPRMTKVGKFLRKYSLDELPQIINVINGEMSLVGPRPLPIEQIEREDLRQYKRLEVRPGITGLWQIRGRSDISFLRLVKWDIWYINNWSLWLDLNILIQTIPVILSGKGAY